MPDHNQLMEYERQEYKARIANQRHQLTAQKEVGRRAQMVVEHPGYQVLLDHIGGLMDMAKKRLEAETAEMVAGNKLGDGLNELKLSVTRLHTEIKTLQRIADLIPTLIERGNQAAKMLETA